MMTVNEKFKATYTNRFKCFLFMGTNKPVKITDAKSGLLRRLIDVSPSGNKLGARDYKKTVAQIDFELGAIAYHCLNVYLEEPNAYDGYTPTAMMGASNDFYNFVLDSYNIFAKNDGTTLKAAWNMYKEYCDEANVLYPLSRMHFKEELKNYFWTYEDRFNDGETRVRSYYKGFRKDKFKNEDIVDEPEDEFKLKLNCRKSIFDKECASLKAQYATEKETPLSKWTDVTTNLSEIDTSLLHYVKLPINHIVIDFDLKDDDGNKSLERNIEAASKWPPTYAEFSKSGAGIHLHYIYSGDPNQLKRIYEEGIEIKVFNGKSSLRRKLTKCNNLPIATISSGLPLKEDKVVNYEQVKSEKDLRNRVIKTLRKEYDGIPSTRCGIDFITHLLDAAYESGISYDLDDMYDDILAFAANSSHQSEYCMAAVNKMKLHSKDKEEIVEEAIAWDNNAPIVFYDVEVYPNLCLICWKKDGAKNKVNRMYNPTPEEIEELFKYRLIGFNCRRYDNHIVYAAYLGYSNKQIYEVSQSIINGGKGDQNNSSYFSQAWNMSYTDIYDFSSKKQSLKKWEIELGIHHQEMEFPWDEPVPEDKWHLVGEYCDNDVLATEALFHSPKIQADWTGRQILASMAGMTVNDTTNTLTTRIIFGKNKTPGLVYTNLSTGEMYDSHENLIKIKESNAFPGYEYVYDQDDKKWKNMYRGTDVSKGGYVYSVPGMYGNVALLDVASLHPNSAIQLEYFGEYTQNFKDILDARLYIKHGEFAKARTMLDGKLAPYLTDESAAKDLAQALKIAINSVYGLTSATFTNPFKDERNRNNIVALRGALFMRTLLDEVEEKGYKVIHIKTDSIKIADADQSIINFVMEFGQRYGYTFEHEATYEKICLIDKANYVAKYDTGEWTVTGDAFANPYVFKTLFTHEAITFDDMCTAKSATTAIYIDYNEALPDGEHDYHFIGKVGNFVPIAPGCGGGMLKRKALDKNGNVKYDALTGTKDYRWLEAEFVQDCKLEDDVDMNYFTDKVDEAVKELNKWGDAEWFMSDAPYEGSMLQAENTIPF